MKIAYLAESVVPSTTANSIHVMKMCQAFSCLGHQVLLICFMNNRYEMNSITNEYEFYSVSPSFKIKKLRVLGVLGARFLNGFRMIREVLKFKPDLVYGRFLPGCYLASIMGFRTCIESHIPAWCYSKFEYFCFNRLIKNRNFIFVTVISHEIKKAYLNKNDNIKSDRIIVEHDGADPSEIEIVGGEYLGGVEIGYVGSLYPGKGVDVVIHLSKKFSNCNFHVVGGSYNEVQFWKKQAGSVKNLKFHGFCTQKECEKIRLEMDILIAPYKKKVEPSGGRGDIAQWMSPLKIFEYMAAGKLIIASNHFTIQEILKHNEEALLVSAENLVAWEEALAKAINDRQLRQELGKRAKEKFLNYYTWKARAKRIIENVQNVSLYKKRSTF